jgi:HK97 family phage prohead protease
MSDLSVFCKDMRRSLALQHDDLLRQSRLREEHRQRVYDRWDRQEREERERQKRLEEDQRLQGRLQALIDSLSPVETKCAAHAPSWAVAAGYVKAINSNGEFTAYASTFGGSGDCVGDVIWPGCFSSTIKAHGERGMPLCWQHDLKEPIGRARQLEEDSVGLRFKGCLELESPRAREAFAFLKNQGLDSFSIGYRIIQSKPRKGGGLDLLEVNVREISVVTLACNGHARMV